MCTCVFFYVSGLYERSKLIRKCTRAEGMEFSIPMRLLSRYFDLPFLVPQKRVVGKITRPDTRPSVADGWAGASNLNPHHKSPTHMHKKHLKLNKPNRPTVAC